MSRCCTAQSVVKATVHVVIVPPIIQSKEGARNEGDVINGFKASTVFSIWKEQARCANKVENVDETLLIDGVHS